MDSAIFNQPERVSVRFFLGKIKKPDANESVPLRNQIESTDLQVFYQPEGVSLRFYPQPEANAFRLIKPNRCNNYYLFNLLSGKLSNAFRLIYPTNQGFRSEVALSN